MLATAENATANWKEEEYSHGKWEAGGLQHHIFHLREVTKKMRRNTVFLVAK